MDFNAVIDKIMSDVRDGSVEPFIIYRDSKGSWHGDHTQTQYDEEYDWVEDVKYSDPLAVVYTGKDFARGSFSHVYDTVLYDRIRSEYFIDNSSGKDSDNLNALTCFFYENVSEFSHEVTDYLTTLERPLAALQEMCPFDMATDNKEWTYNEDYSSDAIDAIEKAVENRLYKLPEKAVSDKRTIEGYEERNSFQLSGRLVILAENANAELPYLVCEARWDNPFGAEEYYNAIATDSYLEAVGEFIRRETGLLQYLEHEYERSGAPFHALTIDDCVPNGLNENLEGKAIIIKSETLSPEFRTASHQLKIAKGGFGCAPDSRGNAVFCTDLYSGKDSRFERWDVLGVADIEKLPEWTQAKLAVLEAIKKPDVFEYGGNHFKPYRKFHKGETERKLKGDSRSWKNDAQYAARNMASDFELNFRNNGSKEQRWSYELFYAAADNNTADIFTCIENGKLYVPAENELFQYNEPPQRAQSKKEKPSLLDKLDKAKAEAAAHNAERKDAPKTKKRGDMEVD